MIKLLDILNEEKHMTPAQKKKRGKIYDKLVAGGMEKSKAGAIATSKAMAEKLDPVGQEDEDIDNDGDTDKTDKYLLNRRKAIAANIKEDFKPGDTVTLDGEEVIITRISDDGRIYVRRKKDSAILGKMPEKWVKPKDLKQINEGDHEVAMAQASLEAIAEAAIELSQKIGGIERNIPGWIQDHIAKAENYIEQAAQGFHELKHDE